MASPHSAPTPHQKAALARAFKAAVERGHDEGELRAAVGRPYTRAEVAGATLFLEGLK